MLVTAHLRPIRQHRFQSAHESAQLLTSTWEMDSRVSEPVPTQLLSLCNPVLRRESSLTLHLNGRLWALAASGTNNVSIIFSPFFLIGNLLPRNTKRPGWESADERMATPPTAVGRRAPEQSLWDGEAGAEWVRSPYGDAPGTGRSSTYPSEPHGGVPESSPVPTGLKKLQITKNNS